MLSELTLTLISVLSFLLPTQLGLHINSLSTFVYGFKIDYLTPTIYLTDLIAILIIVTSLLKIKFSRKTIVVGIFYLLFAVLNISFSLNYIPALYKWLKLTEFVLLGVMIYKNKKFDVVKHFIKPLSYSIVLVCVLGILQFVNKGSIGGIFYYLGERSLRFSDPNVSPYPYATFSHPNSFAGFLLIFQILFIKYKNKFNNKHFWLVTALVVLNIILANSLNVFMVIGILLLLNFKNNLFNSFVFIDYSQRFITHRLELIKAAFLMIKENLLIGVGLNNFIPLLPSVSNTFLNSWELQPVHNIYILVLAEMGILGLLSLGLIFYGVFNLYNFPLLAILITGLSDHYWLTLQQNMLLFTYVLAINYKCKRKN